MKWHFPVLNWGFQYNKYVWIRFNFLPGREGKLFGRCRCCRRCSGNARCRRTPAEGGSSSGTRWPLEGDEVLAESRSQDDSAENKGIYVTYFTKWSGQFWNHFMATPSHSIIYKFSFFFVTNPHTKRIFCKFGFFMSVLMRNIMVPCYYVF